MPLGGRTTQPSAFAASSHTLAAAIFAWFISRPTHTTAAEATATHTAATTTTASGAGTGTTTRNGRGRRLGCRR